MATTKQILEELKQQSYIQLPFDLTEAQIEQAIIAFFQFLDEPKEIKQVINFSIAPNHRRGDVGYQQRQADDHIYNDNKEFFHFHPAIFDRFQGYLAEQQIVANFLHQARLIWDIVYNFVLNIFTLLEPVYPGIVDKIFATSKSHILLRFLKYDWQQSGKYLAKPHYDAGSFTLAIAESCPGLRIGRDPRDLKIIKHKPNHAIFMLSSNYQKIINTSDLFPAWHDVIQLDENLIGQPFARWALVAFIDGHGVEALPRTETHKWFTT
ncbi:Uncharacterised protein [Legionella busanensis]|uniref:2OG-Fe(II) oxygenase n=1 Tax=Legionella busanensis TaxID=190655 RepID=A0A378JHU9_9GAMM|nr:hypothetical protein [Legionella busanensis]STX50886.1 Uncharacterised protein [Legionella busanensis]